MDYLTLWDQLVREQRALLRQVDDCRGAKTLLVRRMIRDGMTVEEIAGLVGVNAKTIKRLADG